jgi:hypothetical protein
MNRASARSVLDGLLIGEDCWSWYGSRIMSPISRLFGNLQHASPLAIDLVGRTAALRHFRGFRSEQAAARADAHSGGAARSRQAWHGMQREISALWYYHANLTPYSRGSLTTGVLLHHSLWLSLFGPARAEAALRCIPPFRSDVLLDFEAQSVRSLEEWVNEVYWEVFEGSAADMLPCFAELHEEEARLGA